ncbi:Uncharacterised protein [uncultured Clostridium sp.]|uniref:hypothetical protein n=1 Tax=uncultured Clostridium sp. TaxID=59620 RepID=UPI000821EFF9|nr:hypothetical protein [uncultured Clostridium sp.]SCK04596.1 Uncharacterised protein [uncultured Clostridium sp.]
MEKWITAMMSLGFLSIASSGVVEETFKYVLIIQGLILVIVSYILLKKKKKSKIQDKSS